uniref:Uncharacterized protein n=1 Tax=Anguilla anguilla TaxID=7936 RepID=A0A0E9XQ34_ANGAN
MKPLLLTQKLKWLHAKIDRTCSAAQCLSKFE